MGKNMHTTSLWEIATTSKYGNGRGQYCKVMKQFSE